VCVLEEHLHLRRLAERTDRSCQVSLDLSSSRLIQEYDLRNRTIDMIMHQFTGCTGSKLCVWFSYRDLNKKASSIKNSKAKS